MTSVDIIGDAPTLDPRVRYTDQGDRGPSYTVTAPARPALKITRTPDLIRILDPATGHKGEGPSYLDALRSLTAQD